MCRLFVENQLCCQSEGLLTSATYANVRVLCNQPVTLTPECLSIDGPTNFTTLDVLNANTSYSHQYLVNYQESDYYGHVNIDLQRQRYVGQVSALSYLHGNCKVKRWSPDQICMWSWTIKAAWVVLQWILYTQWQWMLNISINYITLSGQHVVCRNNTAVDCSLISLHALLTAFSTTPFLWCKTWASMS